jgi:hypothetical protein
MKAEVFLPPSLQYLAGNIQSINVEGGTVRECLRALVKLHPDLKHSILTGNGRLHKGLSIYKNGEQADVIDLASPLQEGDKIYILNVIFGG